MSPGEVPPPPYTEQEFDQKVSQALVASAQQPQPQEDQGEWQEWSDAAFAAAEALGSDAVDSSSRPRAGSSTQPSSSYGGYERQTSSLQMLANIEPLKIHKRGKSAGTSATMKPRPSWMDEAELDPSNANHQRPIESQPLSSWNVGQARHEIPPDDDEDNSVPPPPFASMDPPIEARLEYHAESTPPSPLTSPIPDHFPDHPPQSHSMHSEARLEYHAESTPPSPLTSPIPDHFPSAQPDHSPQSLPMHLGAEGYPEPNHDRYSDELLRPSRLPRQSLPMPPHAANYQLEHRPASMLHQSQHQSQGVPRIYPNHHTLAGPSLSPDHLRQRPISMVPPPPPSRLPFNTSTAYNKFGGQSLASQQPVQTFNANAFYK
ncbi:hypothetical protein DXG03_000392 [Asterophora parasitica]|uniref:Uncharacterized protein n=1 Tax=Asterophora parasitica TaxID=117018 RepID=A0A9P7GFE4_9AGAR|nr:hypothetical protein DXG03_000392 [Asterophora parasitica]